LLPARQRLSVIKKYRTENTENTGQKGRTIKKPAGDAGFVQSAVANALAGGQRDETVVGRGGSRGRVGKVKLNGILKDQ